MLSGVLSGLEEEDAMIEIVRGFLLNVVKNFMMFDLTRWRNIDTMLLICVRSFLINVNDLYGKIKTGIECPNFYCKEN